MKGETDPRVDSTKHALQVETSSKSARTRICVFACLVMLPIAFLVTGLQFPAAELLHELQGQVRISSRLSQRRGKADMLTQWASTNNFTLGLVVAGSESLPAVPKAASMSADNGTITSAPSTLATAVPAYAPLSDASESNVQPSPTPPSDKTSSAPAPVTVGAMPGNAPRSCKFRKAQAASHCHDALTTFLAKTRSAARWIFLGDSTMSQLFQRFRGGQKPVENPTRDCTQSKPVQTGCELLDILGLQRPAGGWIKPTPSLEGPKSAKPYCTDCGGCKPSLASGADCVGAAGSSFLPVEFARDREHPTLEGGPTSQETVAYFLSRHPYDVCVVNSGVHDMALKGLTDDQYVANVQFYLRLLVDSNGCRRIVWVQTSSVRGPDSQGNDQHGNPYRYPQNNARLRMWNDLVSALLSSEFSHQVPSQTKQYRKLQQLQRSSIPNDFCILCLNAAACALLMYGAGV